MSDDLKYLFSPVKINSLELKNRAVMPAMGTGYGGRNGQVTDRLVSYLARRAHGGAGLIITEVCAVDPRGRGFPSQIGIWSEEFIEGLSRIPDVVHSEGSMVAAQLHHAGRETFKAVARDIPEAPSSLPSAILMQPCEEMTKNRTRELVEAFASAAHRAVSAGFDAVEIHAAHGYLVNQFLSPFSNQRADEYGGSDENRARFAIEIVEAVRARVGPDYPVIVRVSVEELVRGGYATSFMEWLAPRLVSAGADSIHASVGVYSTPGNLTIPSMDTEPGFNLDRSRAIKAAVAVPVIGVGRICDPRLADQAISRGDADLVSFGRQHLCDPDFLAKAKRGKYDDIRWCLGCNQGCIERLSLEMKSVTCTINPECGREYKGGIEKAEKSKRVWIAGAGPAGLSAALSASERGHEVEVFERAGTPGGQLEPASKPPHKQGFSDWIKWAVRSLDERGVKIRLNEELTAEVLRAGRPDAVIVATGALPARPEIPGIDVENVFDAREVLMGRANPADPAVILGAGYVGMETADYLTVRGIQVTVLEMLATAPVGRHTAHGYWLNRRLLKGGGRIVLGALVKRVEPDAVIYTIDGEEHRERAAMVITALGARPEKDLERSVDELDIPCLVVGDAVEPRRLIEAVHEGHRAGKEILSDTT